jgi:hypothetical protein
MMGVFKYLRNKFKQLIPPHVTSLPDCGTIKSDRKSCEAEVKCGAINCEGNWMVIREEGVNSSSACSTATDQLKEMGFGEV